MSEELKQQSLLKMRMNLVVKFGPNVHLNLPGRVDISDMRVEDLGGLVHLEAYLERLTGYRFHLNVDYEAPEE